MSLDFTERLQKDVILAGAILKPGQRCNHPGCGVAKRP